jgi:hypothetical protein
MYRVCHLPPSPQFLRPWLNYVGPQLNCSSPPVVGGAVAPPYAVRAAQASTSTLPRLSLWILLLHPRLPPRTNIPNLKLFEPRRKAPHMRSLPKFSCLTCTCAAASSPAPRNRKKLREGTRQHDTVIKRNKHQIGFNAQTLPLNIARLCSKNRVG